eukprot:m.478211 g.478211  ORF g.478211 m.478211 type:complete len:376 (+) comp21076_c0_seq1:173-1300(+)
MLACCLFSCSFPLLVSLLPFLLACVLRSSMFCFLSLMKAKTLVVFVVVGVGSGLGTSGGLGHDDLVDTQHGGGCLGGILERPLLDTHAVDDPLFRSVKKQPSVLTLVVKPSRLQPLVVRRIHLRNHLLRLGTGVFGERVGTNLERLCKGVHGVLLQAGNGLGIFLQLVCELHVCCPCTRHKPSVPGHGLVRVDTIVNGTLDVVHNVVGGAADNDGRHEAGLVELSEDGHLRVTNLLDLDLVAGTQLIGSRRRQPRQRRCSNRTAQPPQIILGRQLDRHHAVPFEKVEGHVADLAVGDHDVGASFLDGDNLCLEQLLFALAKLLELRGRLDEHGALGLRLDRVHSARVHGNACLERVCLPALQLAVKHHSFEHRRA